jgi:hypothetical protein
MVARLPRILLHTRLWISLPPSRARYSVRLYQAIYKIMRKNGIDDSRF